MGRDNIVYSTNPDWVEKCPECEKSVDDCVCISKKTSNRQDDIVYIKREVKGRGGKTVTTISHIGAEAKIVQKELQKLCGAGGTFKQGIIEIQGDHREKIRTHLQTNGYVVKFSGG